MLGLLGLFLRGLLLLLRVCFALLLILFGLFLRQLGLLFRGLLVWRGLLLLRALLIFALTFGLLFLLLVRRFVGLGNTSRLRFLPVRQNRCGHQVVSAGRPFVQLDADGIAGGQIIEPHDSALAENVCAVVAFEPVHLAFVLDGEAIVGNAYNQHLG